MIARPVPGTSRLARHSPVATFTVMSCRLKVSLLLVVCAVMIPFRSPAPLVYSPGEGWVYEPVGGLGKWRMERAKDQIAVAQQAFDKKDYDLAARAATRVLITWPISDYAPDAQFLLARCLELKKNDERAFNEYQKLIEKYPKSERVKDALQRQFEIGLRFLRGQRFKIWGYIPFMPDMEKTAGLFEKVVNNGPYSDVAPHAQLRIGAAQEKRKEYGMAVSAYDRALDRYYDRPVIAADAMFRKGLTYERQAKTAEYDQSAAASAIETFTDFIALYPQDRRVQQAQRIVTTLKTEQARGSFQIAKYYESRRKWNGALIYYNESILQDPNSTYANQARVRIEQIKQRQDAATK